MSSISETARTGQLTQAPTTEAAPRAPLAALWSPATIRARCAAITRAVDSGSSGWFRLDRSRLPDLARRVAELTRQRYPELRVPLPTGARPRSWARSTPRRQDTLARRRPPRSRPPEEPVSSGAGNAVSGRLRSPSTDSPRR